MLYFVVKFLHVIGAAVLLGTGIDIAFFMLAAHIGGKAEVIAGVARIVVRADFLFTATAAVAQPITGVLLAENVGHPLSEGWIVWSIALYHLGSSLNRVGDFWGWMSGKAVHCSGILHFGRAVWSLNLAISSGRAAAVRLLGRTLVAATSREKAHHGSQRARGDAVRPVPASEREPAPNGTGVRCGRTRGTSKRAPIALRARGQHGHNHSGR